MPRLCCLIFTAFVLVSACSRDRSVRCTVSANYLEAPSGQQLRVPGDLTLPDESDALLVPGPASPGEGADTRDGCLEFSPALLTAGTEESEETEE